MSGTDFAHPVATATRPEMMSEMPGTVRVWAPTSIDAFTTCRTTEPVARGIAMTTYRTAAEFGERFSSTPLVGDRGQPQFEVDAYLRNRGARFVATTRPERFLALSLSTDLHRVDPSRITAPITIVAAEGDSIVPREQLDTLASRVSGARNLIELPTRVGHDAFLVETARVSSILSAALS